MDTPVDAGINVNEAGFPVDGFTTPPTQEYVNYEASGLIQVTYESSGPNPVQ